MDTSVDYQVQHGFAEATGITIHWAEAGRDTGAPPLVLLHGLHDSHLTWRRVAMMLSRNRRVLMPDLPGHGMSDRPDAAYELGWYARVMAAWLEALQLGEVDVVGHSLGGGVAQMLILECRDRIRRLVLAASGGLGREISALLRLAAIPLVVERFGQPFLGIGTHLALRGVLDVGDLAALSAMNGRPGSARALGRTVRDLIDLRGQRQLFTQRVHELDTLPPTVVIWGDRDRVIPAKHATALTGLVHGVNVTLLEGCGHFLHNDQPERFAKVVREFFDANTVPAAVLRRVSPAQVCRDEVRATRLQTILRMLLRTPAVKGQSGTNIALDIERSNGATP